VPEARIVVGLGKYRIVDLDREHARLLIQSMYDDKGTEDLQEALRIIDNFKDFYDLMQKKNKDYLPLPHSYNDLLRGNTVLDKVKLYKRNGDERVILVFDRRLPIEYIEETLRRIGYTVKIEERLF